MVPYLGHHSQDQACNQHGTPEGAKSFLRGSQIFKLCPTHFSKGVEKFCRGCFAPLVMGLVKIYIKKTIPFGHKLWVLVFNEGYPSLFVWLCKLGERLVLSHCWPMLQAHLASQFMQGNFSYIWQSSLITVSLLQER